MAARVIIVYSRDFEEVAGRLAEYARGKGIKVVVIRDSAAEGLRLVAPPFEARDPEHARAVIDVLASIDGGVATSRRTGA